MDKLKKENEKEKIPGCKVEGTEEFIHDGRVENGKCRCPEHKNLVEADASFCVDMSGNMNHGGWEDQNGNCNVNKGEYCVPFWAKRVL